MDCIAKIADLTDSFDCLSEKLVAAGDSISGVSPELDMIEEKLGHWTGTYRDLRFLMAHFVWDRKIDKFNKWQVFTFGHELEARLDLHYVASLLADRIADALPQNYKVESKPTLKAVAAVPCSTDDVDVMSLSMKLSVVIFGDKRELDVLVYFRLGFGEDQSGVLLLHSAPRTTNSLPSGLRKKIVNEIQSVASGIDVLPKWQSKNFGHLFLLSSNLNEQLCFFFTHKLRSPGEYLRGQPHTHESLPPGYDISLRVAYTTVARSAYADQGSIMELPYTSNNYRFRTKFETTVTVVNIDLKCFGSFKASAGVSKWIDFSLAFQGKIDSDDLDIYSVAKLGSGAVLAEKLVRTIPSVEKAKVGMSNQGDSDIYIKFKN